MGLTNGYLFGGDSVEGEVVAREALEVNRRFGQRRSGSAGPSTQSGLIEAATGRLEDARRYLLEALDLFYRSATSRA